MVTTIRGGVYRRTNGKYYNAKGVEVSKGDARRYYEHRGLEVPEDLAVKKRPAKKAAAKKTAAKGD